MPEPLKLLYNAELVSGLSAALNGVYPRFDSDAFQASVFDTHWQEKELRQRMQHISMMLHAALPGNFKTNIKLLRQVAHEFSGFEYMFFPGYVELYGLDDFETSIEALAHFTEFSSSEFAVRPFIQRYGSRMMAQMTLWADADNHHVRRLASEGCRPRLPWAMSLPEFKENPQPVLELLEKLKADDSEYVRRSVANNLNDISKDHPACVMAVAQRWLGSNRDTDRLVKHACRTLLKQGNADTLALFGFGKPDHVCINLFEIQAVVGLGKTLAFSFQLETESRTLGKIRLEYAVDFMKKNGQLARKIFKISESNISTNLKKVSKKHSFRWISTRVYYSGEHRLAVIVNGQELTRASFILSD